VPVVNGLEATFSDRIDFFHLNVDTPDEFAVANEYELMRRSQYTLIDADGNIVKTWFGLLDEEQMTAELNNILPTLSQ
jgi:hypothetical protein